MSKKFEQLLDYIVNEEMDKANELFHEIVVEKSRSIYENLIAEEEEEQADESAESDEDDEQQNESADEAEVEEGMDDEVDEGEELEDSYSMEAGDDVEPSGDEETGDFEKEIGADDDMDMDDEMGPEEPSEDEAMMDIKSAIEELEAAFAELEAAQGGEMGSDEFGDEEFGDEDEEDLQMGMFEGKKKRMTREYVEKVGNDWDKSGSMKSQGQYAGAGTGDKEGGPQEGRSPISSGSGKPTSHANAKNLVQGASETAPDGTKPHGKAGGFLSGAKEDNAGNGNVPGGKMGVKNLKKVPGGHGAEKKGSGPGPVGSGSGEKAGQTSVSSDKQFLKPYKG